MILYGATRVFSLRGTIHWVGADAELRQEDKFAALLNLIVMLALKVFGDSYHIVPTHILGNLMLKIFILACITT